MNTAMQHETIERLARDPLFRAQVLEEIGWALEAQGKDKRLEELAALWEDLHRFEETLGEVLDPRVTKTCLTAMVGGVAYEDLFGEESAQPSSEESAETEEYEDPESPRWA